MRVKVCGALRPSAFLDNGMQFHLNHLQNTFFVKMHSIMITLSLIASVAMAAPQSAPQSVASTVNDFTAAITQMKTAFSFQGFGPDQVGLTWTKSCDAPWDAQYKISCEKDGLVLAGEWVPTVVSHHNFQGPKIRLGPNGPNACAKVGGLTRVYRLRYGTIEDVTDKLSNFDGNAQYDGKDSVFWDKYGVAS